MRFWRTPDGWLLPGGARVDWLAGGTYDRRVGLSLFTLQITHKIDANIDIERDHIIDTVTQAVPDTSVEVLENFTTSYHSRNGGGDSVHTDGHLPVLDVTAIVPKEQAPDLRPKPSRAMPLQVWLPVAVSLVLVPLVMWLTLRSWSAPDSDRTLAVVTAIGSGVILLMALGTLVRRALARRVLLAVAVLVAVTHLVGLSVAGVQDLQTSHILGAMAAILFTVALSSPKAGEWTTR